LGPRQPGSGLGSTRRRSSRATRFRTTAASRAVRSRADVGCVHAGCAGADFTSGTDMGRGSAAASSRPRARAIVGRVSACGAACADVGIALARTECLGAASRTFMGGAEASGSGTRAAACAIVGRADSIRAA
jgi:hypothetical protein